MNELEERARELIDIARARHGSTAADAARVRAKLRARVLAEPMLLAPIGPPLPQPGWLRRLLAMFAAGSGAGFAAGFWVAQTFGSAAPPATLAPVPGHAVPAQARAANGGVQPLAASQAAEPSPPAQAAAPPAPHPPAPAPALASATPSVEAAARRQPPRAAAPPQEESPRRQSSLEAELEGLRRAQELLHKGDARWALARLDELDRASTSSVLLDERRSARAMAECALGKRESCPRSNRETPPKGPLRQTEPGGSRHE